MTSASARRTMPRVALARLGVDRRDAVRDLAHGRGHDHLLLGHAHPAELDREPPERRGPPAASVCARATWAIDHRPCRIRPGRPTSRAYASSMWIGLKSPDAPA